MPHADLSDFHASASKHEAYASMTSALDELVRDQRNWVCNTANAAALLWHMYRSRPEPQNHVNWAGFYVINLERSSELILGPFQGKVACQTIQLGKGVCGAAASAGEAQVVKDVEKFPGHIACDGETRSEIVVPIVTDREVIGVIDIDCAQLNAFDEVDLERLTEIARMLADACDWHCTDRMGKEDQDRCTITS